MPKDSRTIKLSAASLARAKKVARTYLGPTSGAMEAAKKRQKKRSSRKK